MGKTIKAITAIYTQQFFKLVDQAHQIHKANFIAGIELCQLISVKTGGCPEDCGYCSQSNKYDTKIKLNSLLPITQVEQQVIIAKQHGIQRICLGAAYKSPTNQALNKAGEYISVIKKHGLEACITFGSISLAQAIKLKAFGLDYYNHNIDTSPKYYPKVVTTRTFQDRIATITNIGRAGIKVCCGGILGMGESQSDRIDFIQALTNLPYKPDSIPINIQVKIPATPLAITPKLDKFELVKTIATLRILFPTTKIRLSAGRKDLSQLEQSLCFIAGANSIFYGDKLLTTTNNKINDDQLLLFKLGITFNANMV